MKKTLLLSLILPALWVSAQNISSTITLLPPGYTSNQARQINDLKVINDTLFWIGFQQIGLARYDGVTWTVYNTTNSSLPVNAVQAVELDAAGNVWAGTSNGLARFDGTNWTVYNTSNSGIAGNYVLSLKASGNNLWIGTQTGISFLSGSTFTNYTTSNSALSNDNINSIVIRNNETWFCTNQGLNRFVSGNWTNWQFANNLITNVAFDFNNDAWVTAAAKIYRLNIGSGSIDDLEQTYIPERFNEQFALNVPKYAVTADANGNVYFLCRPAEISYRYFALFRYSPAGYNYYYAPFDSVNNAFNPLGSRVIPLSGNRLLIVPRFASVNKTGVFDFAATPVNLQFNFGFDNVKNLNKNNVSARMMTRGAMHWDLSNARYEVPAGSGKHTVFASALWIGGIDENGEVRVAAQTYRQNAGVDFFPGPIEGINVPFDSASCQRYDRIWKINREKTEEFVINFQNGNVGNGTYSVHDDFKTWPANGNNNLTGSFAPIVDFNNDGIYNPYDGDYPKIKGDQMLYWMFNDSLGPHTETESKQIGIEVHAKAYSFSRPATTLLNKTLNNTTFYHYRIINRGIHNYDSVYIGLWSDVDLGKYDDDLIGCDSALNAGFGFNGDNDDEGSGGYGLNPPMQNVLVLSGPQPYPNDGLDNNNNGLIDETGEECRMTNFVYYNNDFSISGNPTTGIHYYNYMRTHDKSGAPIINPLTGIFSKFMINGTPYSPGFPVPGMAIPGDRRFLIGSGPFRLHAGEETCIEFAYIFSRDSINPNGLNTSVAVNIAAIQAIDAFYRDSIHISCLDFPTAVNTLPAGRPAALKIYPNPTTDFIIADAPDLTENTAYRISDIAGRTVQSGSIRNNKIFLSGLKEGLYFLTVNAGKQVLTVKFVKQ